MVVAVVRAAAVCALAAACQRSSDRLQSGQDDAVLARGVDTRVSTYKDPQPPRTAPPPVPEPAALPAIEISGQTRKERVADLSFLVPVEWARRPDSALPGVPAFILPGPAGDAELIIYRFAHDAAAFAGWRARVMTIAEAAGAGRGEAQAMVRGPLGITLLDVPGSRAAEALPAPIARPVRPDERLLGAIVEGDEQRYFFAALGPAATMALWEQAFADFTTTFAIDYRP